LSSIEIADESPALPDSLLLSRTLALSDHDRISEESNSGSMASLSIQPLFLQSIALLSVRRELLEDGNPGSIRPVFRRRNAELVTMR
jgi:hypothetical protein